MAMLPSPLNIARSDFLSPNSYLHFFPSKPTCRFRNRSLIITFSYKPRNEIDGNDKKREFLEQYGLNPDEFLSKPSTKIKRKRDQGNTGMRNVTHSETKEPKKERGRGERGMKG